MGVGASGRVRVGPPADRATLPHARIRRGPVGIQLALIGTFVYELSHAPVGWAYIKNPMASYTATVVWERDSARFADNRYSRAHVWRFDGGAEVPAAASPHAVPPSLTDPAGVDPEEAFVASLSSCHMLWFLSVAAKRGFVVERYEDEAEGVMAEDDAGRIAITEVTLRPRVVYAPEATPNADEDRTLHHAAHEKCFIANSVRTEVRVVPRFGEADDAP